MQPFKVVIVISNKTAFNVIRIYSRLFRGGIPFFLFHLNCFQMNSVVKIHPFYVLWRLTFELYIGVSWEIIYNTAIKDDSFFCAPTEQYISKCVLAGLFWCKVPKPYGECHFEMTLIMCIAYVFKKFHS